MLFVSRYTRNAVSIQSEVKDVVQIDGVLRARIVKPEIIVQFSEGVLMSTKERVAALRKFRERWGEGAMGAMPHTIAGVMSDGSGAYAASDPLVRLSGFRTDDQGMVPTDEREFYESRLMDPACGFGNDYVLVEAGGVDKPWPSYDDAGQGSAQSIPKMVRDLGIDPEMVLEYEMASKNRPGVIDGLKKIVAEKADASLDLRTFEVVVS